MACGGPLNNFAFLIPAHTGAGSVSRHLDGLEAGSRYTVIEVVDGHTHAVAVVATGRRQKVTISANRNATAHLTDAFITKLRPRPRPPRVTG